MNKAFLFLHRVKIVSEIPEHTKVINNNKKETLNFLF